jgi:glycosyltransferase involved in cell wall biosynthesis
LSEAQQGTSRGPRTLGYLIPEFPGQTHIFIWREIEQLQRLGQSIRLFSTREPPEADRARHAFASVASAETCYLWPPSPLRLARALGWALARPRRLLDTLRFALTVEVDAKPSWRTVLPLVVPACLLSYEMVRSRVAHLHVHSCANSALLALLAKRLTGVPFSLVVHGDLHWWGGALEEKFSESAFTMVITRQLLDEVRRTFPTLREDQVLLGPMGVDTDRWRSAGRSRSPGSFRLVSVGRLHAAKGHDTAIQAVHQLAAQGRDVALSIIGAGPERDALAALVSSLGVSNRVQLRGSLSEGEIIELMNDAHAFALASHSEPLGVAYMEAMSMELPTIGTDAGGVGELITDGVNGLLVPPRDVDGLARAIARLMDDPALRSALGGAGRKSVVERFDSRRGATALHRRIRA